MAPDIAGLNLPGGGRLPAEHGKPGCSDLEEAGDSGGMYWMSIFLSPLSLKTCWRTEGMVAETPEGSTQMNLAANLGFRPRERKENIGSPSK
jgi:hypothetical protein